MTGTTPVDDRSDEDTMQRFLTVNGLTVDGVVAEVTARLADPELAIAEFGPATVLMRGLVGEVKDAGGLTAVDLPAFVENQLACRAVVASWKPADMDGLLGRLWDRVQARVTAEGAR